MSEILISGNMPVLALRGIVVFPDQTIHFDIGRVKSALALEEAMKRDQRLILVPQKNILDDDPGLNELYPIGTVVKVKQILKAHNDNVRVLVKGLYRAKVLELTQSVPFLAGSVQRLEEVTVADSLKARALRRDAAALLGRYPRRLMTSMTLFAVSLLTLQSRFPSLSLLAFSTMETRDVETPASLATSRIVIFFAINPMLYTNS